jgi:cytochrome c556
MAGMAQGKVPFNAEVVRRNAAYLDNLSRMAWDGFDPNTKDVKSAALPAVYEQGDKFKEAAARLENEAHKLYQVSQSGDENAVKAQIGAVGKACGGCHESFRQKQ